MVEHDDDEHQRQQVRLAHLTAQIENAIQDPDLRLAALAQASAESMVLHDGRIDQDLDRLESALAAALLEIELFGFVTRWQLA